MKCNARKTRIKKNKTKPYDDLAEEIQPKKHTHKYARRMMEWDKESLRIFKTHEIDNNTIIYNKKKGKQ